MTDREPFRFFVFVESGILVFPVRIGSFGSWGPFRWRCVGVVRPLGFGFAGEFIEETVHDGYDSRGEYDDWRDTAVRWSLGVVNPNP